MWNHLTDIDAVVNSSTITLRISKSDHRAFPAYTWRLGVRVDENTFHSHLRSELLGLREMRTAIADLMTRAGAAIAEDRTKHAQKIKEEDASLEARRQAHLAGKNASDPNANKGLNAKGKTQKKREKEKRKEGVSS